MAVRKMTFSLPAEIAAKFVRRVPARERSGYIAKALAEKLEERDRALIRACEIANEHAGVRAVEREWDAIDDPIGEPWKPGRAKGRNDRVPR
jgi:ubiquinone biosynthesis protein UbiJ